jgi:hypothetical protein
MLRGEGPVEGLASLLRPYRPLPHAPSADLPLHQGSNVSVVVMTAGSDPVASFPLLFRFGRRRGGRSQHMEGPPVSSFCQSTNIDATASAGGIFVALHSYGWRAVNDGRIDSESRRIARFRRQFLYVCACSLRTRKVPLGLIAGANLLLRRRTSPRAARACTAQSAHSFTPWRGASRAARRAAEDGRPPVVPVSTARLPIAKLRTADDEAGGKLTRSPTSRPCRTP